MVHTSSIGGAGRVEAARQRDEGAFDSLVGPLIDPAFKLALVMLRDPHEAEDAVQEATVKAWRGLGGLRDEGAVRPWFLSIVANHCRSVRRGRWWSTIRLESTPPELKEGDYRDELALDLGRELSRLPSTDRTALFLFYYLDLPLGEVARILKISPQAAKSRVHRAVARLRLGMVEVAP